MNKDYWYKVADWCFVVSVPHFVDMDAALPSFQSFKVGEPSGDVLFSLTSTEEDFMVGVKPDTEIVECDFDGGFARLYKQGTYYLAMQYEKGSAVNYLKLGEKYVENYAKIDWTDTYAAAILNSMIRIVYAQSCIYRETISLHASAVVLGEKAYLFMGKSGTGKSTHSDMWMKAFGKEAQLLNDDNPIVRLFPTGAMAYGSPWSGKRDYYKNEGYSIGALVRLKQATNNNYVRLTGTSAFTAILPGCSTMRSDKEQNEELFKTLIKLVGTTRVGQMECLPTMQAALLCFNSINNY